MARNRFSNEGEVADEAAPVEATPAVTGEAAAPVEATAEKPKRYVVAAGASLVGARGQLGPGEQLHDGELSSEQLEAFTAAGVVVAEA